MCFFHISQLGDVVSSLFSNFGTVWAIFKIQSAKLVKISPGLTKYPPIIHTCRYTDTSGHTAYSIVGLESLWDYINLHALV